MKKIFAILLGCIFTILLCGCSLFGDYSSTIKQNWGVVLPEESGYKQIYDMQTEPSFHGDGFRYHVFSIEDITLVENTFSWTSAQQETNFYDSYTESCEGWLDEIGVPQSERPTYSECVYYYDSQSDLSEIIMLLSKTQSKLYVVESFL